MSVPISLFCFLMSALSILLILYSNFSSPKQWTGNMGEVLRPLNTSVDSSQSRSKLEEIFEGRRAAYSVSDPVTSHLTMCSPTLFGINSRDIYTTRYKIMTPSGLMRPVSPGRYSALYRDCMIFWTIPYPGTSQTFKSGDLETLGGLK